MTKEPTATRARSSERRSRHLHDLVVGIAAGDRSAFRTLYANLAMQVWRDVSRSMPQPVDSQAVTRSTFIDVWHLARYHLDDDGGTDTVAWIAAIAAQKVEQRLRAGVARGDYDRHTYREFATLIGAGRTAPGTPTV
jgi:DNA-directed RNA polymerase specialized sigma24 family protein